MNLREAYQGKSVFVTGHRGFKGTWLVEYLRLLGVECISGYDLKSGNDISNRLVLASAMTSKRHDFFFHLAAQSQVAIGYEQPCDTYKSNVGGTINFLQGLRCVNWPCAAVIVTTDKVYRQSARNIPFVETDPLGGHDPYSSSKAAAEIAVQSWVSSYLAKGGHVNVCTVRSGNAIGGGDPNLGRIVPNFFACAAKGEPVKLWLPNAVRPWLHVMDAVEGYLMAGARLASPYPYCPAYNFGPSSVTDHRAVKELTLELLKHWHGSYQETAPTFFEEPSIRLNSNLALADLGWKNRISFEDACRLTCEWHKEPSIQSTVRQLKAHANI